MGKFAKAKSEQAFFKVALYGKTGSGKTLTSLLWAEGLAAREGKRVAFVDTDRGSEFYSIDIPERTVHPKAFDFDRLIMRSLIETLEAAESIDPKTHGVLVIDSITHLWEAARARRYFEAPGVDPELLKDSGYIEYQLGLDIEGRQLSFGTKEEEYNGRRSVKVVWIGKPLDPNLSRSAARFFGGTTGDGAIAGEETPF